MMVVMQWTVDRRNSGLPLLEQLQRQTPTATRSYLNRLLRQGKCLCNGRSADHENQPTTGDLLQLPNSRKLEELARECPPLVVCFENDELLIVDKPPGQAVHRTGQDETTLADLVQQLALRQGLPCRLAPITRLDRGTSGLVSFAKGRMAAGKFGTQVMEHRWKKCYLALVAGQLEAKGQLCKQVSSHGKPRPARASYRLLHCASGWSLALVTLETGRTHQIRQQFAALGHPMVGDRRYGGPMEASLDGPFLHCVRLQIPLETSLLDLSAPLPCRRKDLLKKLWM